MLLLLPEGKGVPGNGLNAIGVGPGQEGVQVRLIHQRNGSELHAHRRAGHAHRRQEAIQILPVVIAKAAGLVKAQHARILRGKLGV